MSSTLTDMRRILDIAPLRSFVAVAECGGFQRAATSLHLSQAAVSQHVRRLESATGRVLVERQGRGSRLTPDGEHLLRQARRILAIHDETLHGFGMETEETVVIGSTEHAAAQLLPFLAAALEQSLPRYRIRFRIDRGTNLREGLEAGRIDLALLLGPATDPRATTVGDLELTWYSSPLWRRPAATQPMPVVAFDHPCALRTCALEALSSHAIPAVIGAEAIQLAGVQAAVGAGLGVALMATLGQTPEGLIARDDLPKPASLPLAVWSRHGLASIISERVAAALGGLLAEPAAAETAVESRQLARRG
ncbi:transcriptional regulator [Frankia torreyi]|uniref:Transcriptional regulator n=2 Tax=Frankia TaxID=1854 RepID=A0A0D8BJ67_9ACTN|nr:MULTISPECIES: LysR family transcriptional regulator [Frankia]KJE23442.1 transcriptional regulator [Frankia torreyi]KQM05556.1 transcriptional regulator [Frankia sp. CpI1-P]